MPDIPGNSSTTTVITVGGVAVSDQLEFIGDHDWVRIELTAGQKITISVDGITLDDSYLRVRDSLGNQLAENDDISNGVVRDSRLVFTAPSTGTYYLDISAFNDAGTGTYQLKVETWAPPQVVPVSELAAFLSDGYWGGEQHHFAATQGSTINVNLTALTAAGQSLAREALLLWSDITGITFREVSTGGQITFDDNETGAFATAQRSNGITSSAHVNVSTQWLSTYGFTTSSYSFQTYVHEIGHALGLGHAGYYNGEGDYATDALFANDGWPLSIMSYFDQQDNSYFTALGFTKAFATTPMIADIQAIGTLYGLSTITRTGDTTYGFGNNSGRAVYNSSFGAVTAYTIFDSGGIDTLDYSGYSENQRISLVSETFSNVGAGIGNVSIALGTVIENAVGGDGNDQLIGNSANNRLDGGFGNDALTGGGGVDTLIGGSGTDTLTGGDGGDIFRDTASGLSGDTITDFTVGDQIVFSNATLAGFTFNLSGSTLSYTGGSLTLTGGVSGTLVASAASGGGVQLAIQTVAVPVADVRNDFNGDGRSDILWRNVDGQLSDWLGQANGGFVQNNANAAAVVPTSWQIAGTGDFNGDGRDDILWRNVDGQLSNWLATATGGFTQNNANAAAVVSTAWQVVGTGDFNGDGRDDILWRNTDGTVTDWLATAAGGFTANDANAARFVPTSWTVVGTGDFNGDGRDDILSRNSNGQLSDWLGQANGGFVLNDANALINVDTSWKVAGTGDFNGDGRDDILWRNDNGQLSNWLGQANGGFVNNGAISGVFVPLAWSVVAVGDYNGDGRDDILWRNTNGTVTDWLGNANGSFTPNDANAAQVVPTVWHVQPEAPFI
ncbi:MAG: FG-GAP-like repeat-containing protein [Sphingomicrobium sp.]